MLDVQSSAVAVLSRDGKAANPGALAHGEGYAEFRDDAELAAAQSGVALRFVDHRGQPTERYPYNPNGSPQGIAGLTTPDGRVHDPDAASGKRLAQRADVVAPDGWGEASPWLRMFRTRALWLG